MSRPGIGWLAHLRGLHRSLVGHTEGFADGGPGVAGGSGVCDEFGAAGGHRVHASLEGGEGFEGVVGHEHTVTGVAVFEQTCNYSCMVDGAIKPGYEVTYTGHSWLGHAVEHTHGHGFVLDVHNDHASVLYGSSVLIVPTGELAFYRDRLQVAWEAQVRS